MRNGLKDGKSVGGVKAAATSLGDAGVSLAVSCLLLKVEIFRIHPFLIIFRRIRSKLTRLSQGRETTGETWGTGDDARQKRQHATPLGCGA